MKNHFLIILLFCLISIPSFVHSLTEQLNCKTNDIYSQNSIIVNDKEKAYIEIEVTKPKTTSFNVTMIALVFNIKDLNNVGYDESELKFLVCSTGLIMAGKCKEENKFIIDEKNKKFDVLAELFQINENTKYPYKENLKYDVKETGLYSVILKPLSEDDYDSSFDIISNVEWHSSTGELPGDSYPLLKLYGFLALVYILLCILWIVNAYKYRQNLLPIHHYITAITILISVEMIMIFIYYNHLNNTNDNSTVLSIISGILCSGRTSLSFFILLVICMGYGVVKQSLGRKMKKALILTLIIFVLNVMIIKFNRNVLYMLLLILIMVIFYIWIFISLIKSIKELKNDEQNDKLNMFLNLRRVLIICTILILVSLVGNFYYTRGIQDVHFIDDHWSTKWFWYYGFTSLIYLLGFTSILFLWRPSTNKEEHEQLPTTDIGKDNFGKEQSKGIMEIKIDPKLNENENEPILNEDENEPKLNEDENEPKLNEDDNKPELNEDEKTEKMSKGDNSALSDNKETCIDIDEEKIDNINNSNKKDGDN